MSLDDRDIKELKKSGFDTNKMQIYPEEFKIMKTSSKKLNKVGSTKM